MNAYDILDRLYRDFPDLIFDRFPIPLPYTGDQKIKAILLGADPTHIIDRLPLHLKMVFGLDLEYSPYWTGINKNLNKIQGLSFRNIYVQNVCRNYFTVETSKNKEWIRIAREYWIPYLKLELDNMFDSNVPILLTTEYILKSSLLDDKVIPKASQIYKECITISRDSNLFRRELLALYRHPRYSLKLHNTYSDFLSNKFCH